MCMAPSEVPHVFANVGSMNATVVVRSFERDERVDWTSGPQLLAQVTLETALIKRTNAFFSALWDSRTPDGMSPNDFVDHRGAAADPGPNAMIMPGRIPALVLESIAPIDTALEDAAAMIAGLLRWRCNIPGPIALVGKGQEWSADGMQWRADCRRSPFPNVSFGPDLVVNDARRADLSTMLATQTREPLHQSLLREASSLRASNPRSALAIVVTAAETAIKSLVGQLAPEASWLVRNLPSPPLAKIVEEYLPTLPHTVPIKFAPELVKGLKIIVTARNELVHGKGIELDDAALERGYAAIRDIVWLCDYFGGIAWAVNRVRPETLAAMGLKPTVDNVGWFVD